MGFEKREFFLLVVLVLLNSSAISTASRPLSTNSDDLIEVFEDWALEHKRVYPTEEEKQRRFENFRATYEFVDKFYKEGGESKLYTVGLNAFADMTNEEFYDAHACFVDHAYDVVSSSTMTSSSSSAKVYENKEQELCGGVADWTALGMINAHTSLFHFADLIVKVNLFRGPYS
ncbi:putative ananain protein [Rosa chinensis]|uniref:Putative ananain protein n=1 Tax=Rosa chinensis TaxID=74649 RepID=A0A2P6PBC7_ROSCH|nr:putative ananain protein [Rosa chinensis]